MCPWNAHLAIHREGEGGTQTEPDAWLTSRLYLIGSLGIRRRKLNTQLTAEFQSGTVTEILDLVHILMSLCWLSSPSSAVSKTKNLDLTLEKIHRESLDLSLSRPSASAQSDLSDRLQDTIILEMTAKWSSLLCFPHALPFWLVLGKTDAGCSEEITKTTSSGTYFFFFLLFIYLSSRQVKYWGFCALKIFNQRGYWKET